MINSRFVVGLLFATLGVFYIVLGFILGAPPCVGRYAPGTWPAFNVADVYSGIPFGITGLVILIWSFLSKNSGISSTEVIEED